MRYSDTMLAAAGAVSRFPTFLAKFRQYFCQEPEGATRSFTEKLPGGGEMPVTTDMFRGGGDL